MKRYDIRVRYSFEGTYTVAAEDRDEAKRMVNDDCGLVLGGDIHTTRDDDEVLEWDFCIHPDTRILSLQERGGKGSLPSEAVDFSGRIKELRGDIIDAIRQLLHASIHWQLLLLYRTNFLFGSAFLFVQNYYKAFGLE